MAPIQSVHRAGPNGNCGSTPTGRSAVTHSRSPALDHVTAVASPAPSQNSQPGGRSRSRKSWLRITRRSGWRARSRRAAAGALGLDGGRARARHLGLLGGDELRALGARLQPLDDSVAMLATKNLPYSHGTSSVRDEFLMEGSGTDVGFY